MAVHNFDLKGQARHWPDISCYNIAVPSNRKNWGLETIRESGTNPVILNIVGARPTASTSQQRGKYRSRNHNCMMN